MKHIFIVNPMAGSFGGGAGIRERLGELTEQYDVDVYETAAPHDATRFVNEYCNEHPDEDVRFYACGGDGTLNEVANGLREHPNASLGCYPGGSGNDFVKYYGGRERFSDLKALLDAPDEPIDLIRLNDPEKGIDVCSVNVTNFGFDTCVAKTMISVKHKKIIGGKNAYKTGVATALLKAMKNVCTVTVDGEVLNPKGKMLLCTVANGNYVGGSFRCAPRSVNNDGLLDICLVKPISRFRFLKLLGPYTAGEHLDDERFNDCILWRRSASVQIDAPEGFSVSLDGEIVETNHFTCEVLPGAIRFAIPALRAEEKPADEPAKAEEPAAV